MGTFALYSAALEIVQSESVEPLRSFLAANPSVINLRDPESDYTLLHHASGRRPEVSEALIQAGHFVDAVVKGEATPLHFAASLGNSAVVKLLVRSDARLDIEAGGSGGTPLVWALFYGHHETASKLAKSLLEPRNLRVASGLNDESLLRSFFSDGKLNADAGLARGFQRPHDYFRVMPGANTDDEILYDAFHYACRNEALSAIGFLLEKGVDINDKRYLGATGLHFAAVWGKERAVRYLLERGAAPGIRDDVYNGTVADWAIHGHHDNILNIIRQRQ